MLLIEFWLNRLPRALGAGLLCCVLLGGVVHAQAPEQGVAGPAAPAPAAAASPDRPGCRPGARRRYPSPAAREAAAPPAADVAPGLLPRDLTPWGMFMSADIVVKAVMIGLIFASVLTWTIWLAKTLELIGARRSLARAHGVLDRGAFARRSRQARELSRAGRWRG